jgi:hypothetical protein
MSAEPNIQMKTAFADLVGAADVQAIEALTGTGLAARTADDTWALRTLTGPAAGITVTNGGGVAGNPTLALANDLAAYEGLATSGVVVRTGDGTAATRTITAPAAGITVSNGDGVAGNPTLALANDLAALEGLSAAGMIARTGDGTAAVRTLTAGAGISITNGDGVAGNPTIAATGGTGTVTSVALSLPSIITVSGSPVTTSGTLTGTLATQTANTVFSGPTTGAAAAPTFRALVADDVPNISAAKITSGTLDAARLPTHTHSAADITSGTLGVGRGGTGITTTPTNGQIPIGNGSGYVAAAITAGSGITVTNGSGSITIAASGSAAISGLCQVRMQVGATLFVNTADVPSATTIYIYPYSGNSIGLYNTSSGLWEILTGVTSSFSVPTGTSGHIYDVFAYNNSGTVAYETLSWGGSSSRATGLAMLDGAPVKSGDNSRRYIGSFRLDTTNSTCDTRQKRFIWNYYNRVQQELFSEEGGASHTYNTATWREWNASTSYRLEYILGLVEDAPTFAIYGGVSGAADPRIALAFNSATTPSPTAGLYSIGTATQMSTSMAARRGTSAVLGYNYVTALQYTGGGTGTYDKLQLTGTVLG